MEITLKHLKAIKDALHLASVVAEASDLDNETVGQKALTAFEYECSTINSTDASEIRSLFKDVDARIKIEQDNLNL